MIERHPGTSCCRPWFGAAALALTLAALAIFGAGKILQQRGASAAAAKPQWKLAVQTYTFNRFTLFEAIEKAKAAGIKYIEAYPGQRLSPDERDVSFSHDSPLSVLAKVKVKLEKEGIGLLNYGVVGLSKDEAASRKVFDFAKVMGIETIVSEPPFDAFDVVEKLAEEYSVNVALHNHPKPSPYWDPDTVLKQVEGRSKRIGACADTGHWMRSDVRPLDAIRKLKGRIISSHFKDLNKMGRPGEHDVIWGTGQAEARKILEELHAQGFSGVFSIEYEHNWENSLPDVKACAEWFYKVTEEIGK
ncbi:MAG: sugar phosphate isomerase/epimerase [Planctomycetes bacterium]|nr:sugar phosphate isomerase/epimerase [Planctomycetota bacterium]